MSNQTFTVKAFNCLNKCNKTTAKCCATILLPCRKRKTKFRGYMNMFLHLHWGTTGIVYDKIVTTWHYVNLCWQSWPHTAAKTFTMLFFCDVSFFFLYEWLSKWVNDVAMTFFFFLFKNQKIWNCRECQNQNYFTYNLKKKNKEEENHKTLKGGEKLLNMLCLNWILFTSMNFYFPEVFFSFSEAQHVCPVSAVKIAAYFCCMCLS